MFLKNRFARTSTLLIALLICGREIVAAEKNVCNDVSIPDSIVYVRNEFALSGELYFYNSCPPSSETAVMLNSGVPLLASKMKSFKAEVFQELWSKLEATAICLNDDEAIPEILQEKQIHFYNGDGQFCYKNLSDQDDIASTLNQIYSDVQSNGSDAVGPLNF